MSRAGKLGAVYTPTVLAEWTASLLLRRLSKMGEGLILDPACGDGALLRSVSQSSSSFHLAGLDIDKAAIKRASANLGDAATLVCGDALEPDPELNSTEGWLRILNGQKPVGIIANPPWGVRLKQSNTRLKQLGFKLAHGQFDSFEIFIELALKIARVGAPIVLIVPDSIFQPEHQSLRNLLCSRTALRLIARLGEGFFENVYRGAVVIVLENRAPASSSKTACMRLTKNWRDAIQSGQQTFKAAERALIHFVPQRRFQDDARNRFDIDLAESEAPRIALMEKHVDGWTNWLTSSRGVELSKSGDVIYCPECKQAQPRPRLDRSIACEACGCVYPSKSAKSDSIVVVNKRASANWKPFIVGEDVDRYSAEPSRYIRSDVVGINYKTDAIFKYRKILVRKTGVGIKAAIDESGALTNQVVFLYGLKHPNAPKFLLDYFLGVLCSRVMLAYYLKTRGENEWRSHPYLTQRIISELPVPNIKENTWQWKQAKAIAEAVKQRTNSRTMEADLYVEQLVAGLFEFSKSDCTWILNVLDNAQALEPIRTLRVSAPQGLQPLRA